MGASKTHGVQEEAAMLGVKDSYGPF